MHKATPTTLQFSGTPSTGAIVDVPMFKNCARLLGFGRFFGEETADWTTTPIQDVYDGIRAECTLTRQLGSISEKVGIWEYLAPSASEFNGHICKSYQLYKRIQLGAVGRRPMMRRGCKADGCLVEANQAFYLSVQGCAVLIAWREDTGQMCAAHGGLKSFLRERSVATNMLRELGVHDKVSAERVEVVIAFSIEPEKLKYEWHYPNDEEKNQALCREILDRYGQACLPGDPHEGRVHLEQIAVTEFNRLGVTRIKTISAPSDYGKEELWYTTRGKNNGSNGVIVARYT